MLHQLLWLETLLKLAGGVVLIIGPNAASRVFGLPTARPSLWPRLLGAVLLGLAAATYIEGALPGSRGLGLGGAIAVNLASAAMIFSLVVLNRGVETGRGRVALSLLAGLLVLLSLFEIAAL